MAIQNTAAHDAVEEPALLRRLRGHFASEPATLPVIRQQFAEYERANLHFALEEMLAAPERGAELTGVVRVRDFDAPTLARLSRAASASHFDEGPVEHVDVPLPGDQQVACVKNGLYLIRDDTTPVALLFTEERRGWPSDTIVEAMAPEREQAERFLRQLTRLTRHGKAFRGHVLSLQLDCHRQITVQFHHLPRIARDELILPEGLLRRLERHTLSFSRHAERLRTAGRHLKRGILLYGPPGTGKTLSAMYLAAQMHGRTVIILTGAGMSSLDTACKLGRMLQPATVILEDVDLIGTQRHMQTVDANALLFELLNQMDGLADDTDVLFILTTNRPDILEPALAARPGRIDQAIEIPLPDAACRRRLLVLYARGMQVELTDWESVVDRTAGASGAFIRELLRKAAVFAAEDDEQSPLIVRDADLQEALGELLIAGGPFTQSLLGAAGVCDEGEP